jgi:hypothetical protein
MARWKGVAQNGQPKCPRTTRPPVTLVSIWVARVLVVLAAAASLSTLMGGLSLSAIIEDPFTSGPVLANYGVVLAFLLKRGPPAFASGMQLGLGSAFTTFMLLTLSSFASAALVVGIPAAWLGSILLAGLLNFLMIPSAVIGRLSPLRSRKAWLEFFFGFLSLAAVSSIYLWTVWRAANDHS